MSKIRILSDHLANQIAAGEVVERPASVVKELLENSVDAGAGRISVHVEGGGTRLIRVQDNGCGMDSDDVLLCLERHATSKLRDEAGLQAITSLGFRGEAIPSIGSVSRLTIISRTRNQETGTRAEVHYGTLRAVREEGCSRGTVIEVRGLFGNIPARKKFLKSGRTELFHIEEVIKNQALAHPDIGFELLIDGRRRLDYQAVAAPIPRLRAVYRFKGPLLELTQEAGSPVRIQGALLLPEAASGSARLRFLVNGRPVQDRMLRHAVHEGMTDLLMRTMSPAGLIALTLDPGDVDVNVHPAKREIRFRNSQEVHRQVESAVRRAVADHQERERKRLFQTPASHPGSSHDDRHRQQPRPDNPIRSPRQATITDRSAPVVLSEPEPAPPAIAPTPATDDPATMGVQPPDVSPLTTPSGGLVLIGQLLDLYLLCEQDGQLVVIDQHAAHERILYSRLREGYGRGEIPVQQLLFAKTVDLEPVLAETAQQQADQVRDMGMRVEPFGDLTWIIKGVPAPLATLDPEEVFREILAALAPGRSRTEGAIPESVDRLLATLACRAAIKAGNRLRPEEMVDLLKQMGNNEFFTHCPHGRPVMKTFSSRDIEQWFRRT